MGHRRGGGAKRVSLVASAGDARGTVAIFEWSGTHQRQLQLESRGASGHDGIAGGNAEFPPAHLAAGEMRELGTASPELHREAGQFAAKTGKIDWIIAVAGDASQIVEGAVTAGLPRE